MMTEEREREREKVQICFNDEIFEFSFSISTSSHFRLDDIDHNNKQKSKITMNREIWDYNVSLEFACWPFVVEVGANCCWPFVDEAIPPYSRL